MKEKPSPISGYRRIDDRNGYLAYPRTLEYRPGEFGHHYAGWSPCII